MTDNAALIPALASHIGYEATFGKQLLQAPISADDLAIDHQRQRRLAERPHGYMVNHIPGVIS